MEDTQTGTEDNEAIIAEMVRDAKIVAMPSELGDNPVIHKGDEELPAPMVGKVISSAGYVEVWDTRTFEKIPILYYMLAKKMRQRRKDGSFRFTTTDPGKLPKRGKIICRLHKDGENREHYNQLGLRVCPKDNILNPHELKQHMLKKHPKEWATIEDERKDRERAEDRELNRALLAANMPKAPLYVKDKKK